MQGSAPSSSNLGKKKKREKKRGAPPPPLIRLSSGGRVRIMDMYREAVCYAYNPVGGISLYFAQNSI